MTELPALFTKDLKMIKNLRENNVGKPFYFASDAESLNLLLSKKNVNSVFIKRCDFLSETEKIFSEHNCPFYFFNDENDLKNSGFYQTEKFDSKYQDFLPETESKSFNKILGISPEIKKLKYKITKVAATNFPVLITGETGTGKTLVANAVHELSSCGKNKIVETNIMEIKAELFESTLFGHEKGAFTGADDFHKGLFEAASSTTLFLDEIGDLPLNLQAKLLRVIDKKEFFPVGANKVKQTNARLIFATNANLQKKILKGEFRQDLYRRLKNLVIEIPPLRKRKEDIPVLAKAYMKANGNGKYLSESALKFLQNYDWPENIGQLENCLNRAVVFSESKEIGPADIEF